MNKVLDTYTRKLAAWEKGLNPWVTIDNPDGAAKNKLFTRVRANHLWGDPKIGWYYVNKDKKDREES